VWLFKPVGVLKGKTVYHIGVSWRVVTSVNDFFSAHLLLTCAELMTLIVRVHHDLIFVIWSFWQNYGHSISGIICLKWQCLKACFTLLWVFLYNIISTYQELIIVFRVHVFSHCLFTQYFCLHVYFVNVRKKKHNLPETFQRIWNYYVYAFIIYVTVCHIIH
jgi:hypothetical protein